MKLNQFAALAALAVLFASCTSGDEGIFASIEREQKIISLGGLSETATVTSMAEVGGAVNKYFATGGKALFSRSTDPNAKTWHKSTVGGNAAVSAVGAAGGRVFAVAEGVLFVSTDGSNWTKVDLASGDRAYDLVPARKGDGVTADALIVVAATAESDAVAYRSIYLIDAAGNLSAAIALSTSPLSAPVRAAAYDGTDYILLSETSLWRVSPSFVVSPIPVTGVSGHDFAGLIYLDGSESVNKHSGYYLSTLSNAGVGGGIYKATAIGEFTALKTAVKVLQKAVGFGGWLYCAANDSLWVATGAAMESEGTGYMELLLENDTLSTTPKTDNNNYTSTTLDIMAVGTLFRSNSGLHFLGSVAHGLWVWDTSTKVWSRQ